MIELKENDTFYVDTHAELLNQVFETNYKSWMRSSWDVTHNTYVWMVRFDNIERDGWRNYFISSDRLRQVNVTGRGEWGNQIINNDGKYRIVFSIENDFHGKKYVFKGVFKYDREKSDPHGTEEYYKVSSVYPFKIKLPTKPPLPPFNYLECIGKIARRKDGLEGIVEDGNERCLYLKITNTIRAGKIIEISVRALQENPDLFIFSKQ